MKDFQELMNKTTAWLNKDAKGKEEYYAGRNGEPLEEDVFKALKKCAKGTPFENKIRRTGKHDFPDIIVADRFGVEVKSTKDDKFTSTGSSILESSRVPGVEQIYLTFGKLHSPVTFISKPYEECLSGIAVTHYPRYQINMELKAGQTIFDLMQIPYDELRNMENPAQKFIEYYSKNLKEGERLWWMNSQDIDKDGAPPKIVLWKNLPAKSKKELTIEGFVLFPEVIKCGGLSKYNNFALWLVIKHSVLNNNVRDLFSAGGKVNMKTIDGQEVEMPAVFGKIKKHKNEIVKLLLDIDEEMLSECWGIPIIKNNRLRQWCGIMHKHADSYGYIKHTLSWKVILEIFPELKAKENIKSIYETIIESDEESLLNVAEKSTTYTPKTKK